MNYYEYIYIYGCIRVSEAIGGFQVISFKPLVISGKPMVEQPHNGLFPRQAKGGRG
jgi:hypothetical protein